MQGLVIRDGKVTLKLSSNSCSRAAFYPSAGSKTAIAGYDLSTALHLAKLCAASVVNPFPLLQRSYSFAKSRRYSPLSFQS
jgi:hypothetical protein